MKKSEKEKHVSHVPQLTNVWNELNLRGRLVHVVIAL